MRIATALALLVSAGACDGPVAPPADNAAAPVAPAAPPAAPVSRQIGQTSALAGSASALTATVSDFQVARTETETRINLAADTLFAFDRADLTPAATANLERTATLVGEGAAGTVRVVGHTDAKGDDAYNDALSLRRADAVAAWLRARPDLPGRSYATEGRGKREPIAPNALPGGGDDPAGRARNRRVEVIVPR